MHQDRQPPRKTWGVEELMASLKFAGKLDVYRRLKDLTIVELAEKVGVPAKTMERLLTGKNAPCAATAFRIARALDIVFDAEDFEEYDDGIGGRR